MPETLERAFARCEEGLTRIPGPLGVHITLDHHFPESEDNIKALIICYFRFGRRVQIEHLRWPGCLGEASYHV